VKYRLFRIAIWLMPFTALIGCTHTVERPVIQTQVQTVKVPVSVPCRKGETPQAPVALRDRFTREEWDALTTDQRENLSQAQAQDRKAYGDKLAVNTAGCE